MATEVRLFAHSGVVSPDLVQSSRFQTDAVFLLKQPYLARAHVTAGATAQASPPTLSESQHTTLVYVQVAPGGQVRYEINPPGRDVAADAGSPLVTGNETLMFGRDYTISLIEA
jgi:hypothetical protein